MGNGHTLPISEMNKFQTSILRLRAISFLILENGPYGSTCGRFKGSLISLIHSESILQAATTKK